MDEGLTTGYDMLQPQMQNSLAKQESANSRLEEHLKGAKQKLNSLGVVAEDYPLDVSAV